MVLKKYGKSIKELPEINVHMLKSVTDVKYEPSQIEDEYDIETLLSWLFDNSKVLKKAMY